MAKLRADCILKFAFFRANSDDLILPRKAILFEEKLRSPFVSRPIVLFILRIAIDIQHDVLSLVRHAYFARKRDGQKIFGVGKTDLLFELQKGVVVLEAGVVQACLEVFEESPGFDLVIFLCDPTCCNVQLERRVNTPILFTVNVGGRSKHKILRQQNRTSTPIQPILSPIR